MFISNQKYNSNDGLVILEEFKTYNQVPKILENMSKIVPIIVDFSKINSLIMSMKQLPLEFFKTVASFLGHLVAPSAFLHCLVIVSLH